MTNIGLPPKQGLYDPRFEHDACGLGVVANIKGKKSNKILRQALTVLRNLDHRGGQGADKNTGDGAGILLQIPHAFFDKECAKMETKLPPFGEYAVGMVFLPPDIVERENCQRHFEKIIEENGQKIITWRTVPVDNSSLGEKAKLSQPFIAQVFIAPGELTKHKLLIDKKYFERKLYIIRRQAENKIRYGGLKGGKYFYVASLSASTVVYKGMLTTEQLDHFYLDLKDLSIETALALVHSRFSTNTFPSWERAHPYRYVMHNGEINTLRGNINWMHARQALCESDLFGNEIEKILPIIDENGSDSGMFDNCLEFLIMSGRSIPHAAMMMVPEPWAKQQNMSDEKKAFFEYHSCMMEAWDGPAAMAFTDGKIICAVLDRNGLRPSRYYITKDDMIVLASEVGVLDIDPDNIVSKDRLQPGRMLLVDTEAGRIVSDEEIKNKIAGEKPYRDWIDKYMINLCDLPLTIELPEPEDDTLRKRQLSFGYTLEELTKMLRPMAAEGTDPVGAMGHDIPLAVLSEKPHLLYNYFKQLFAQVTNPPIDALREEIFTDTSTTIGPEKNLISPVPESCRQIRVKTPILSNEDLAKIACIKADGFKSATIPILYPINEGGEGLKKALKMICQKADEEIVNGSNLLIISDRGISSEYGAIPALLAVSCLHHHLIRNGTRLKASILLESGEPREVHHFAVLLGYGASGVNPYLAFETIKDMINKGLIVNTTYEEAIKNYSKAITKGIAKVLSKMGISTVQSYQGAQIFEAIGISSEVIDRYFTWTPSRLEGIGLTEIAEEVRLRHSKAFSDNPDKTLDSGSIGQWRHDDEQHMYNPETIVTLQQACRTNNYTLFKKYTNLLDNESEKTSTLRGLLSFSPQRLPISIEKVESVESIYKRFKTGAMSYGSLSQEVHECMAIAMNRIGGKSNTGEGGEDPSRFISSANGDSKKSAIKQVASGRFGVTSQYLVNADEIQIKIAQGAKPGEGGQLPGRKVYPWIAKVRGTTAGVGLISPPPHHDIYSIEDLAELIHDLKNANPRAKISVKLVSEVGVGTIAAGVAKAHADVVLISGYDGGTGASPRTSIRHAGLPWEIGLAETHQTLLLNNLRDRITVETDGKLMTGRDVVIAALLGAEEFGFATAPLVVLGCVMMRVCNLDTCPVGVATQNPALRQNFKGKPEHLENFMRFIAQEVREYMAELGFHTINEMIGRTEVLEGTKNRNWKAQKLDISPLLYKPDVEPGTGQYCQKTQNHGLDKSLDTRELLAICAPALKRKEKVEICLPIKNTDRVVGTLLGSEVTRLFGAEGLPEDTISLKFKGSAGQSFGAFIPKGITLTLQGDANDHVGKGLSGGKLIVFPPVEAGFIPAENIIIGNVGLYGATSGQAYICGIAGERFCVRNSGASAVIEGVGDHACEYMTGGRVVILGNTGRNFAAGMSGGIAYVLDEEETLAMRCNTEMVLLEKLSDADEIQELKTMIENHLQLTNSKIAKKVLENWEQSLAKFVRVIPKDYKKMIQKINNYIYEGLDQEEAINRAFNENKDN